MYRLDRCCVHAGAFGVGVVFRTLISGMSIDCNRGWESRRPGDHVSEEGQLGQRIGTSQFVADAEVARSSPRTS